MTDLYRLDLINNAYNKISDKSIEYIKNKIFNNDEGIINYSYEGYDPFENTLFVSLFFNRVDIINLLIDQNINPYFQVALDSIPYILGVFFRNVRDGSYSIKQYDALKLLIEKNKNFNIQFRHDNNTTILMLFIRYKNSGSFIRISHIGSKGVEQIKELANILINKEQDLNLKDKDGDTALIYASRFKDIDLVEMLIAKGADQNIRSIKENKTVHDYLKKYGLKIENNKVSKI